jgi:predicted HicB family RNase H-like nuclease
MNSKLRRTLDAIFETPMRANIKFADIEFADIERLLIGFGGTLIESKGSAIRINFLDGVQFNAHRPHPQRSEAISGRRCPNGHPAFGQGAKMSNTLEYKGYKASIEFDDRDEIFVGRVLGLDPMSFHGLSIEDLKSAFKESIDFHLELAAESGERAKPHSGKVLFRFDPNLHARIAAAAKRSGKSINDFGKEVFEKALA